ncbi:MAG: FecR domain-containing protein, partial [Alphaproteobacteria bacterium]|nr:FecR domain-containing protein [Alphaproteobacteria bacterium]
FLAVFSFFYVQTEGVADDTSGSIGKVYSLAGGVIITRADGTKVAISKGTAIFQDDVIETAADGKLGIVFNDDTTFSLGGDSRMVIDTMIYDAAANTGESDIDVLAGTFSFVSGKIAKAGDDAMTVSTPVATIGIRGTTVAGHAAAEGSQNTITLMPDLDGGVGQIGVTSGGQTTIMSVAFQTTTVTSAFVP